MSDHEDYGDLDEGLADRIREAARERGAEAALASPFELVEADPILVGLWATILADYAREARRQEQVTAAYLEVRLGMRL